MTNITPKELQLLNTAIGEAQVELARQLCNYDISEENYEERSADYEALRRKLNNEYDQLPPLELTPAYNITNTL